MAVRVLKGMSKYEHITPVLQDLHWLPLEQRIMFRLFVRTFKGLYGKAPPYICDMVSFLEFTHARRSPGRYRLKANFKH